jgi:hypothetical protein
MRKKVRAAFLVLAGFLTFFAAQQAKAAFCEESCWDDGTGHICCTTSRCFDFCY